MKQLLKLLVASVLSLALCVPVFGQTPIDAYQTLTSGTASIASGATGTLGLVIDCRRQANVGVQFAVIYNSAGTTNTATFTVTRSADGTTYDTIGTPVVLTANGTTQVVTLTNLPSNGARFMKVTTCVNSAGASVTNLAVGYALKISSP
jgi:hypothetical protein